MEEMSVTKEHGAYYTCAHTHHNKYCTQLTEKTFHIIWSDCTTTKTIYDALVDQYN